VPPAHQRKLFMFHAPDLPADDGIDGRRRIVRGHVDHAALDERKALPALQIGERVGPYRNQLFLKGANASAITATVTDVSAFRSGRDFAAWIGLVPRQDSTGGKPKLGPISKQGDRYLRRILVVGAHSVLRRAKQDPEKHPWLMQLLARRPFKVVAIALANKMARVAWALLARGGIYQAPRLAAA